MKATVLIVSLLVLCGCQKQAEPPKDQAAAEPHPESATNWTTKTELFMEYPPLITGQTSRFAVHLTRLDNFKPVTAGKVEILLLRDGKAAQSFATESPSRPGIFGVDVKPAAVGDFTLVVRLSGAGLADEHQFNGVAVHDSKTAAIHEHGADMPDLIAFLKEQQWTLDFATAIVEDRDLRSSLRVPAEVRPRSGGEAEVTVPFNGRLVLPRVPVLGERVAQGQVLASLLPPTSAPSDLTSLDLARDEATLALQLARKDRERAERLVASGAAPGKRLDEARTVEATADARLRAAIARIAQYDASSAANPPANSAKLFALRAPIAGVIHSVTAAPGSNVEAGETLFQIVDADRVYVSAVVPETELPLVRNLSGAELEIPGVEAPRKLRNPVSIGRIVDPQSRTFPVVYEVNNTDRRLAINQALHMRLLTTGSGPAPAVPDSAVIDDGGRPIVFVQLVGETFQRRAVRLGVREAGYVQVLDGVFPGERIVTKGAHLIRLASMSSHVPAHGHVH